MNAVLKSEDEINDTMAITMPSSERENDDRLVFPIDLSEWLPRESLMESIVAFVEEMNWSNPELIAYLAAHPDYHPKMLLRLMSFAYATGRFDGEEIETCCFSDPFFRYLCEGAPPRSSQISRFRRANRFLLKSILAQVFREALKKKYNLGNVLLPAGLRRFLAETAGERLDLARHLDRGGRDL
jgi:hypothetical protein